MPSWLTDIPQLDRSTLVGLRKSLDQAYRSFSREFGADIEAFFDPLLVFLVWFEKLLVNAPWWAVILAVAVIIWGLTRSWKLIAGMIVAFLLIGFFGMWKDTMSTMAIIAVCTLISIVLGVPIGILMGALGPHAGGDDADPRCHADHAGLRLFDPGGDAAGHRQGAGRAGGRGLRHPAGNPVDQSGHPPG